MCSYFSDAEMITVPTFGSDEATDIMVKNYVIFIDTGGSDTEASY